MPPSTAALGAPSALLKGPDASEIGAEKHATECRRDIIGLILVKELALINPEDRLTITEMRMRSLPMLRADTAMCAHLAELPSSQLCLRIKIENSELLSCAHNSS
jgi:hypothetical protein